MARNEVCGGTEEEIRSLRGKYYNTPLWKDYSVPFETAYCLRPITAQPDDYDGPERYCRRRVAKADDYDGHKYDEEAFGQFCPKHGGVMNPPEENLENPRTAPLKAGLQAEDKSLIMDFTDAEQALFESIMEGWPEIYDWPDKEEDPARYRLLRRVAVNEVRSVRAEDYIDERGEVITQDIFDENGQKQGEEERENPLAREYRLLMSDITDQMKELGLTPKERQKMDTMEAEENRHDAVSEIAGEALTQGDKEYDPSEFEDG